MSTPTGDKRGNIRQTAKTSTTTTATVAAKITPARSSRRSTTNSPQSTLKQQQQQQHRSNGVVTSHSSSSPSTMRLTPLALALQAQWTLLQQNIQLGVIPVTAERELLVVLESLPEHKNAILSDVEGVLPYILAFAVAPIPSERTQVIALGAMHATVGSLIAVWGKKAAAVLVHNFLTVEHNALHALEVALSVALVEEDIEEKGKEREREGRPSQQKNNLNDKKNFYKKCGMIITETRSAVIGGALELLLMMVSISTPTAAAALTYPKLIHSILRCIPVATAVQACDIASILHTLSNVDGAAVEVLVEYKVYHAALLYIRTSLRSGIGLVPNATVTALCMFIRLLIQLTKSPASFAILREDSSTPHMMEELVCSQWGEVMELGCQWITTVMEQHTAYCAEWIAEMLFKTQIGERLSSVVMWNSSMIAYAAAAALCWRWFALANSTATGSFIISNPNLLLYLLQILATTTLPPPPSPSTTLMMMPISLQLAETGDLQDASNKNLVIHRLVTEVVCTLGLCYGLGSRETRASMHRLVLHRLSNVTKAEIQRRITFMFANLDKSYFAQYPAITLTHKREYLSGESQPDGRNFTNTVIDIDDDNDEENGEEIVVVKNKKKEHGIYSSNNNNNNHHHHIVPETEKELDDKRDRVRSLETSEEWRRFLLHALTRLFRGNAQGTTTTTTVPVSLIPHHRNHQQQQQQFGAITTGPSTLLRMPPPPPLSSSSSIGHRHYHHHNNNNNNNNCYTDPTSVAPTCSTGQSPLAQWDVVRRAELMGGSFYLDSIRVILQLAHHYKHGVKKSEQHVGTKAQAGSASNSATRVSGRQGKAPNPWALPEKLDFSRRWSIEDVQRSDVLLFYVSYDSIVSDLEEAAAAVEEHTKYLSQCLRLCPTKAVLRRCLLNDLYMHVYPKIHMFLLFIQHHMARSRPVLQIIADKERAIHSGNILEIYEAVGHCVGGNAVESGVGWEHQR